MRNCNICYACNDGELLNVRVDIEEKTRKFNFDLNKISTCNIPFVEKFRKFNNDFLLMMIIFLSLFILLQVLINLTYGIL
jgi:hypothetical protein